MFHSKNLCQWKQKSKSLTTASEIKFIWITATYPWVHYKKNEDMLQELKTEIISDKILKHKAEWFKDLIDWKETDFQTIKKLQITWTTKSKTNFKDTFGWLQE
jgi:hypothetical protein